MKKTEYIAKGLVYGKLWGGGTGAYPSEVVQAKTLKTLEKKILKGIETGALDSGMGYEELIGAIMNITKITTIEQNGEEYHKKDNELKFYGTLSEKEKNFLTETFLYI